MVVPQYAANLLLLLSYSTCTCPSCGCLISPSPEQVGAPISLGLQSVTAFALSSCLDVGLMLLRVAHQQCIKKGTNLSATKAMGLIIQ